MGPVVVPARPEGARPAATRRRLALAGAALALAALGGSALPAAAAPTAGATAVEDAICGTWVLQQVMTSADLARLRPQIERALEVPGVVGFSVRVPWKAVDGDLGILDAARAIAAGKGRQLSVRFMAGRHTPTRVLDAGPTYALPSGERVPSPFAADGGPNVGFERAFGTFVGELAAWSRAHDVRLLHLAWYGQDWAELNHGKELRAVPGYTADRWLAAHERLIDIGAAVAGDDLAVELPLSGYGPVSHNGLATGLADHIVERVGAGSPRFYIQANGWSDVADWGAPDADTEARMDEVWTRPIRRGVQAIQPEDYDWAAAFARASANDATYTEVYTPSFSGAQAAGLAAAAGRFAEGCAAPTPVPPTTVPPTTVPPTTVPPTTVPPTTVPPTTVPPTTVPPTTVPPTTVPPTTVPPVAPPRDTAAPQTALLAPADGRRVPLRPLAITGRATDDRAVAGVQVGVRDARTGRWWRPGTGWSTTRTTWAASVTGAGSRSATWATTWSPPAAGDYVVVATARDAAGTADPSAATRTVQVRRTAR